MGECEHRLPYHYDQLHAVLAIALFSKSEEFNADNNLATM